MKKGAGWRASDWIWKNSMCILSCLGVPVFSDLGALSFHDKLWLKPRPQRTLRAAAQACSCSTSEPRRQSTLNGLRGSTRGPLLHQRLDKLLGGGGGGGQASPSSLQAITSNMPPWDYLSTAFICTKHLKSVSTKALREQRRTWSGGSDLLINRQKAQQHRLDEDQINCLPGICFSAPFHIGFWSIGPLSW